jgi:hypothetical protein
MRRALVLSLMLLATLVAAPPATAAARPPRHAVLLELHQDGFRVQVESRLGKDRVRLLLDRHGEVAYYFVHGEVGDDFVRARFGGLGALDLRFVPDGDEGRLGCAKGQHEGWQRGTFEGSLAFHGEHDYAHVDAHRARGFLQTYPSRCGSKSQGSKAVAAAAESGVAETGAGLYAESAKKLPVTLFYCHTESGRGGYRVYFNALREEERGDMEVIRGVQRWGGAASFQWDLGAGTATVEPPGPISGRAVYHSEGHGKASWRGSLSAPVLGSPRPLRLAGSAFSANLSRLT